MRWALLYMCAACGTNLTPPGEPDAAPLACLPNLDGKIDAAELRAALDVPASYMISPSGNTRAVSLTGTSWDFTQPGGDPVSVFTAAPLAGKWYAASFPGGQFAVPFDATGSLDGIYAEDDQSFRLLGVASTQPSPPEGVTLLPYDAPVALYRFPLAPGLAWTEHGVISKGTLRGLPYVGTDTYDIHVDTDGELALPDVTITQALLVRTTVTVAPSVGAPVTRRQASFLFECLGEVARATSADGETSDDFTTAVEIRRLTFGGSGS
jgi:hypothetical protein